VRARSGAGRSLTPSAPRTDIGRLVFDESQQQRQLSLRDSRAAILPGDYSIVQAEITIGAGRRLTS